MAFTGTASELLEALTPEKPSKTWPNSPRSLSARLRRIAPSLRAVGIAIEPPTEANRQPGTRARLFRIEVAATATAQPPLPTPSPAPTDPVPPPAPDPPDDRVEENI
jgi:hypothetical protein